MEKIAAKTKVYDLSARIAEDRGFELVSVDLLSRGKRSLIRVVIDKDGGVTVGDCEAMSRELGAVLDVEDPVAGSYFLEVSSPGLDRPLVSKRDFEKNIGKLIRIVLREKVENSTFFIGRLIDAGESWIRIEFMLKNERKDMFIPVDTISRAQLEIEIKQRA